MDIPKRSSNGQTVQDGLTPDGIDSNPPQPGAGTTPLDIQLVAGKTGSVTKLDNVQSSAHDSEGMSKPGSKVDADPGATDFPPDGE